MQFQGKTLRPLTLDDLAETMSRQAIPVSRMDGQRTLGDDIAHYPHERQRRGLDRMHDDMHPDPSEPLLERAQLRQHLPDRIAASLDACHGCSSGDDDAGDKLESDSRPSRWEVL